MFLYRLWSPLYALYDLTLFLGGEWGASEVSLMQRRKKFRSTILTCENFVYYFSRTRRIKAAQWLLS